MRWVWVFVASVLLAGCGDSGSSTRDEAPAGSSTTSTTTVADYLSRVAGLWDQAQATKAATEETSSNGYGWLTHASVMRGFAEAMRNLSPPADKEIEHNAIIAEALSLADQLEEVGRNPGTYGGYSASARAIELGTKVRRFTGTVR